MGSDKVEVWYAVEDQDGDEYYEYKTFGEAQRRAGLMSFDRYRGTIRKLVIAKDTGEIIDEDIVEVF